MKELVVISGKGGTGKTSIVASLATLLKNKVLADCDVDAADLHLVLKPDIQEKREFWSGKTASLDQEKCIRCGKCREHCRYDAISADFTIDKIACEGCGLCSYICPQGAISLKVNLAGHLFRSQTAYGPMIHAKLGIAEENSGKLVALVKDTARQVAEDKNFPLILIDGPPGIGCPVIAALSGADTVLIVTEPTISGIHDLERVLKLTTHFKTNTLVCINKYDINKDMTNKIALICNKLKIPVIGYLPFDATFTKAQLKGMSLLEYCPEGETAQELKKVANKIKESMDLLSTSPA